jgi:hypothetical protein
VLTLPFTLAPTKEQEHVDSKLGGFCKHVSGVPDICHVIPGLFEDVTLHRVLKQVPEEVLGTSMMFFICNRSNEPLDISWGRHPLELNMHHGMIEPSDRDVAHDAVGMASAVHPGERIWVIGRTAAGVILRAGIVILEGVENVVELTEA